MIRSIALAAAAAAVGYAVGQRAGDDEQSRFSKPEVTGDDVDGYIDPDDIVVEGDEAKLSDDARRNISSEISNRLDWTDYDEDGRIGQ